MMGNTSKLLLIWILILTSIGSVFIHEYGRLFPGLPILVVSMYCSIIVHYFLLSSNTSVKFYLILIITVVLYRTIFTTVFTESLMGFDPDTYVLSVRALIESGFLQGFNNEFYESVPAFHIFIGTSHLLTDLPISTVMIIFPITASIVFTTSVYAITFRFVRDNHVAMIAAVLVSSSATLVRFSVLPIPQLQAALIFSIFVFTLVLLNDLRTRETVILNIICLVSILYSHKIGLYITSGGLFVTAFIQYFRSDIELILKPLYEKFLVISCGMILVTFTWLFIAIKLSYTLSIVGLGILSIAVLGLFYEDSKIYPTTNEKSAPLLFSLLTTSVIFGIVQWTYLSSYLYALAAYRILPTVSNKGETIIGQQSSLNQAEVADPGLLNPFFHQSHSLLIILSATVGLLALLYRTGIYDNFAPIMGFYAFTSHLVPLGLKSGLYGGIGIQRTALMLLPVSFPLSAYVLNPQQKQSIIKGLTLFLLMTVIIFQVFSVVATPDYPNSYRSYLDSEEAQGKSFSYKYIPGTVHTDYFYSTEAVNILPSTRSYARSFEGKYEPIGLILLSGEVTEANYSYISLRTDIRVYRTQVRGAWVLSYDPQAKVSAKYNSIYNNGNVITYNQVK